MSDGSISQDEIDALLAGVDMGGMGASSSAPSAQLNESQKTALQSYVGDNIPGLSSNLASMTGKDASCGQTTIEVLKRDGFLRKIPEMVVASMIDYSSGLQGDHVFILPQEFAQKIVSLVNNEPNAELDEMSLSVISETISQFVGIQLTALDKNGLKGVSNAPAESLNVPKAMVRFPQQDFVVVTYPVNLDGTAFSFWEIMPLQTAIDISNAFGASQGDGAGFGQDQMGMNGMGQGQGMGQMPNMGMGQMPNMGMGQMPNMGMGQMPNMGMGQMQGMGMGQMPNMGMGQMQGMGQVMGMNPNVQAVQYPSLQMSPMGTEQGNIGLIMDVYMEMTVELGRTRKVIKEILGMGEGTIIELDKLAGEPVDILVNHKPIAKGEVVVIDENFGVRVTEILSPIERVSEM